MSKPTTPPPLKSLWGALSSPEPEIEEAPTELRPVRIRGRAYAIFVPAPSSDAALELLGRICDHLFKDPETKAYLAKFGLFDKPPPQSHLVIDLKGHDVYAAASSIHVSTAQILAIDHLASALSTGRQKFADLDKILLQCELKVVRL